MFIQKFIPAGMIQIKNTKMNIDMKASPVLGPILDTCANS